MATEEDARRIALSLPETTEKPSYGTPGFRVKDKLFARLHDMPDTLVVWVADMDEKEVLLGSAPERYFQTDGFVPKGMVGPLSHAWCIGLLLYACEAALELPELR